MYKIPLVDLALQHQKLQTQIKRAIDRIVKSNTFIMGPDVALFEEEFAAFCKARYCVGVASGTAALYIALITSGIGPADEVITVPNTFIATAEAITQSRARVVFCDIDPHTHTMDPQSLKDKITSHTKAIIPVHLYGNPCAMDSLGGIAKKHKLHIIDDAAQAHGAQYKNIRIGNWGKATTFSFFPAKNLGAWGDAGAIVTNDRDMYEKMKLLVNHGRTQKYIHTIVGYNYRLDTLQAGILMIKLKYLDQWNTRRRQHAQLYRHLLASIPEITCIEETPQGKSVYHLFVICHPKRDSIKKHLAQKGIETGIHYPIPLHLQPAYRFLGYTKGDFPVAEEKAAQILSLPLYPELTNKHIKTIVSCIKEALFIKKHG